MRLSELIKVPTEDVKAPAPPPPPKKKVQTPASPPISPALVENRETIEKEFQAKLSKVESDARRFAEQRIKEEEQKFLDRENVFMTENQKMLGELDDLRKKNNELIRGVERLQQEMTQRFEEERKKIEQELRKEMSAAAARLVEDNQKKTAETDRLRENEKKLQEEFSRRIEQERLSAQEQARREAAKMTEELQAKILQEQRASPAPAAPKMPSLPPAPVKPPTETQVIFVDAATEEKIRALYEELLRASEDVFKKVAEKSTPNLEVLSKVLGSMVDFALEKSADMIAIVLEPYRETNYFPCHAVNCSVLSVILGLDFKLSRDELVELAHAAILHDASLMNVRENLDYPKALAPTVQDEIKQHPKKSAQIFEGLLSEEALTGILQHHETLNGKGYPDGIDAKVMHIYAKIIQCVDSFEAMTHQRPYRKKPMDVSSAIKEIIETGRGVYDRDVLKALMSRVGLYPVMTLVELSNKQIARVVRQNRQFPLSPVVRIEFDEAGNKLKSPPILDLKENQLVHIVGPLSPVVTYGAKQVKGGKKPAKYKKWTLLKEIIPFLLILGLIAVFVYVLLKI